MFNPFVMLLKDTSCFLCFLYKPHCLRITELSTLVQRGNTKWYTGMQPLFSSHQTLYLTTDTVLFLSIPEPSRTMKATFVLQHSNSGGPFCSVLLYVSQVQSTCGFQVLLNVFGLSAQACWNWGRRVSSRESSTARPFQEHLSPLHKKNAHRRT